MSPGSPNGELGPPDEIRDITDFSGVRTKELPKEATARTVAHSLLLTFRVSLWGTLLLGFTTIIVDHWGGKGQAGALIKDSVVPMLTSAGTFGSTLFGPLLAFVLGYYFGERKNP